MALLLAGLLVSRAPVEADGPFTETETAVNAVTVTYGNPTITLTAAVTAEEPVTAGTVTFSVRNSAGITLAITTASVTGGTASRTLRLPAGTGAAGYTITAAYRDPTGTYGPSKGTGSLTINPATLYVRAGDATVQYGQALPPFTYTVSGFQYQDTPAVIHGTITCAAVADTGHTGQSPVRCRGGSAANYTLTYLDGALVRTKAPATVAAGEQFRTYGDLTSDWAYTVSGLVNGDTPAVVSGVTCAPADGARDVGTYTIRCSGAVAADYTFTYVDGRVTITPAPLSVRVRPAFREYGEANPAFTAELQGFRYDDTAAVLGGTLTCASAAGPESEPGPYPVTCAGLTAANYAITYLPGVLTVLPHRSVTTVAGAHAIFGQSSVPLAVGVSPQAAGGTVYIKVVRGAAVVAEAGPFPVTGGTAVATVSLAGLGPGKYRLLVSYSGSRRYASSAAEAGLVIDIVRTQGGK